MITDLQRVTETRYVVLEPESCLVRPRLSFFLSFSQLLQAQRSALSASFLYCSPSAALHSTPRADGVILIPFVSQFISLTSQNYLFDVFEKTTQFV